MESRDFRNSWYSCSLRPSSLALLPLLPTRTTNLPSSADPDVRTSWARRCKWPALEALVAFATPGLYLATCVLIRVNPRDRIGQIAGISSLELRFFLFGIALIAALVIAATIREGRGFERTARLVCAAAAGLATGLVAGGILVALRGTPFGLHTKGGDVTTLIQWARALDAGGGGDPLYPPLSVHLLSLWAKIANVPLENAVKHLQIAGTLAFGPLSYLAWRMLLRPGWALGIAVVVVLPLIDPYKPYPHLVLVTFMPLSAAAAASHATAVSIAENLRSHWVSGLARRSRQLAIPRVAVHGRFIPGTPSSPHPRGD